MFYGTIHRYTYTTHAMVIVLHAIQVWGYGWREHLQKPHTHSLTHTHVCCCTPYTMQNMYSINAIAA